MHISEIAHERTNAVADVLKVGQEVQVKVKEIDDLGRINLSMKALIERPAHLPEQEDRPRPAGRGSDRGGKGRFMRGKRN